MALVGKRSHQPGAVPHVNMINSNPLVATYGSAARLA